MIYLRILLREKEI